MSEARRWLAEHAAGTPASLMAAMERTLVAAPSDGPAAEALAEAGLHALRGVVAGHGERGSAVDLLAADALLTCACQAAAAGGAGAVAAFAASLDVSRFETLLAEGAT